MFVNNVGFLIWILKEESNIFTQIYSLDIKSNITALADIVRTTESNFNPAPLTPAPSSKIVSTGYVSTVPPPTPPPSTEIASTGYISIRI